MGYYPSSFNVVVALPKEHAASPQMYSVLNTFSMSEIEVDTAGRQFIFKDLKIQNQFNKEDQALVDQLVELGMVVPEQVNERDRFSEWFDSKVVESTDKMDVTIFTNFTCNLACTYCFQNGMHNNLYMSKQTAEQSLQWMQAKIKKKHIGTLHIDFFGGEPLLNPDAIHYFSRHMHDFAKAEGIAYSSGMTTNGVLLTPELIDELHPLGLKSLKITFDGDKEAHDSKRVFKGGQGSYDIIMQRLDAIAGRGVKIRLDLNYDDSNADRILPLIQDVKRHDFFNDVTNFSFKPISTTYDQIQSGEVDPSCAQCSFSDSNLDHFEQGLQWFKDENIPHGNPIDLGPCEYYNRHAYSVDIKGRLYQCPVFVGIDKYAMGDVWQDFDDSRFHHVKPMEDEACNTCAYTPLCSGGCRYNSLIKTGDETDIDCEKKYFNRIRKSLLWRPHVSGNDEVSDTNVSDV